MSDRNVNININGKDNASRAIGTVGKSTDTLIGKLGGLKTIIGGLALGAAVRYTVGKFNEIAESMDEVGKSSDRLGIATESLGGLKWAAEQSGVEFGELDAAITKMNRNLSEVAKGSAKNTAEALSELGLEIKELRSLAPDKQLEKIADALNQVSDAQDKIRLVQAIFGKSGASLINLLNEGSEGLAKFTAEAEKMGLLFSREEAAKMEEYNDQLNKLSKSWDGLWQSIVKGTAPSVTKALNVANENITDDKRAFWRPFWDTFNAGIANAGMVGDIRNEPAVAGHLRANAYTPEQAARDIAHLRAADPNNPAFGGKALAPVNRINNKNLDEMLKKMEFDKASGGFLGAMGGIKSVFGSVTKTGEEIGLGLSKGIEEGFEQRKKERIAQITEEIKTPQERLIEGLREVTRLEGDGLGAEAARRRRMMLAKEFAPVTDTQLAARDFRALQRAPGASTREVEAARNLQQQLKVSEESLKALKKIEMNTANPPASTAATPPLKPANLRG